jgi:hypothetical protein
MITNGQDYKKVSLVGLSTDTKPVETFDDAKIANGSTFYAMDTGDVFMYDAEHDTWIAAQ